MRRGSVQKVQDEDLKTYKTIVLGDSGVGKSTLLVRFLDDIFTEQNTTLAIDFRTKEVWYGQTKFLLDIYDTAGQERFRVIVKNYFSQSKAAIIVFDVNEEKTLDNVRKWLEQFSESCSMEVPKILLANKCDKLRPAELKKTLQAFGPKIDALKADFNCQFFAVSGKSNLNIKEAFDFLVKAVYEKYVAKETMQSSKVKLGDTGKEKPSRCC